MSSVEAEGEFREQSSVLACLDLLRQLHSDLSIVDICALLLVAERPGASLSDIAEQLEIPKLTVSRALRALASRDFKNALPPALGLIDLRKSSRDGRCLKAHLTDRGESLIRDLNALIERGAQI